jgi:hypothetical protein
MTKDNANCIVYDSSTEAKVVDNHFARIRTTSPSPPAHIAVIGKYNNGISTSGIDGKKNYIDKKPEVLTPPTNGKKADSEYFSAVDRNSDIVYQFSTTADVTAYDCKYFSVVNNTNSEDNNMMKINKSDYTASSAAAVTAFGPNTKKLTNIIDKNSSVGAVKPETPSGVKTVTMATSDILSKKKEIIHQSLILVLVMNLIWCTFLKMSIIRIL